jgi:undecaprenyl-diphosphatase
MTLNSAAFQLAQHIQNPALTSFSKFIAIITDPIVFLALFLAISIFIYLNNTMILRNLGYTKKQEKLRVILLISTSAITAIIVKLLKNTLQIERPISTLIQETGYALPSGHTTFAVVFFGLMTYLFAKPKYKTLCITISIILVSIIAFTRIYLQAHWLTDVIAGLALGATIITLSILAHKKYSK